tara:strand:- start:1068 stop:1541 length:474 start_codon:yes stop_codon:yes gene_type:complete
MKIKSKQMPSLNEGKIYIGDSSNNATNSAYTLPTSDGSANQVLTTDGSGAVTFQNSSASNPDIKLASPSGTYTISTHTGIEEIYILTPSTDITVELPSASSCTSGYKYNIKNMSTNTITIDPDSGASETIDTASTFVLNVQYQSITLITNASNWFII